MKYKLLIIFFCIGVCGFAQNAKETLHIADDIEITRIADNVYMHTSYKVSEQWGPISANGLIYVVGKEAFLLDSPWNDAQTLVLLDWINDSLHAQVTGFVPNHWHEDCMGGLTCITNRHISSYANQMTIDIAREKGLPVPETGFTDSLHLTLGQKEIFCFYPGPAHALDNIVVWLPREKVLFAGCVLKGPEYNNLGFTGDGDINEYPNTLSRVLTKFPDAKIVVPGHGSYGGIEIIHHNIKLTQN